MTKANVFRALPAAAVAALALLTASSNLQAQQANPSSASVSQRFVNYGGTLTNSAGKPVSSNANVTFLIYKNSEGGTPVWKESQKIAPDQTGHYAVQLGSAPGDALPAELFANGASYWLAVQIEKEAEQPRTLLLAVPYSTRSLAQGASRAPSAVVLAVPESGTTAAKATAAPPPSVANRPVGGGVNAIPLFTNSASIQNSVYGSFGGLQVSTAATPSTAAVSGVSDQPGGVGVWGQDNLGTGVFGTGLVGFGTDSNAQQTRTRGGWVKALVWFTGEYDGYIVYCYNSTLSGSAATTPPCGFNWDKTGRGDYIIDLGFEVDDRFFSVSGADPFASVAVCPHAYAFVPCNHTLTNSQVDVTVYDQRVHDYVDTVLSLVVY